METAQRERLIYIHINGKYDINFHHNFSIPRIKKIKQSHYRSGQTLSVSGGSGSQISRQSTHEGGMVVTLTHRPPLPQEIFLVLISVRG
jgi:hypothetical protein